MKRVRLLLICVILSSFSAIIIPLISIAQPPPNITFSNGNFTNWEVSIGYKDNNGSENWPMKYLGSDPKLLQTAFPEYDNAPNGIALRDLNLPINDNNFTQVFDKFKTTLDLTVYKKYVTIGSEHINSNSLARKLVYRFVPTSQNYSVTYAYAIALEDGTHNTNEQPKFTTKVLVNGVSDPCLFYTYQLPTKGGVIDVTAAENEGFKKSKIPTKTPPPYRPNENLYRIWVRDWRIVYLDFSKHIGKNIDIEFEVDNCLPAGHYAYSYVAIKEDFTTPSIMTVEKVFCPGNKVTFLGPNLKNASFEWSATDPANFTFLSNKTNYRADLQINPKPVSLNNQEIKLIIKDTSNLQCYQPWTIKYPLNLLPNAVPGTLAAPTINVCQDSSALLNLSGYDGIIYNLQKSNNKVQWTTIANASLPTATTTYSIKTSPITDSAAFYRLEVINNPNCLGEYTNIVSIKMDSASNPGAITTTSNILCEGQDQSAQLLLLGYKSKIENWEYNDGASWQIINKNSNTLDILKDVPAKPSAAQTNFLYRANISNGVCRSTTPDINIKYISAPYPQSTNSSLIKICYNSSAYIKPNNINGISAQYNWKTTANLMPPTNTLDVTTKNLTKSENFILSIINPGCPNERLDTFAVDVFPQMKTELTNDKGTILNDPSSQDIMVGEPYTYNANTYNVDKSTATFTYNWNIIDPFGFYGSNQFIINNNIATFKPDKLKDLTKLNIVKIKLTSINQATGCPIDRLITARIFNGPPKIYVPTGFTPNGDGLNDDFKPFIPGVVLKSFRIFNRFGKVIFETNDSNKAWDGTFNGVLQNPGTYVWQATGVGRDGSSIKSQKGTVTLIR